MPFGPTKKTRIFQQNMYQIFGSLGGIKVFIDNILMHNKAEEKYLQDIKKVLKILKLHNLAIHFDKIYFF